MDTSSFLNTFFRFFHSCGEATREFWCDNATNLKTGGNELGQSIKSIKWQYVLDKLSPKDIEWKHIFLFSPKKRGSWERLVAMTKIFFLQFWLKNI